MVSEFDLPCSDCGAELVRSEAVLAGDGSAVPIAECPSCGGRYYPEAALERL
ncbi:MAG: hypothetical protein ABEH35_07330 [Haloarculaceae archaeon]